MKKKNIIEQFLHDFRIRSQEGFVCFDARIEFAAPGISRQFPCEVLIQAVGHAWIVYLLDIDVRRYAMPDTYTCTTGNCTYEKDRALVIIQTGVEADNFILKIHPEGTGCKPYTIRELRQKVLN